VDQIRAREEEEDGGEDGENESGQIDHTNYGQFSSGVAK
jgi:hypothetical protein